MDALPVKEDTGADYASTATAFFLSRQLRRFTLTILLLDAAGLSLFCVTGATKSLDHGLGATQAVILGAVTAVGGGTIRDVMVRRVTTVTSGLYAIPALIGAAIAVTAVRTGVCGLPAAPGAAVACFLTGWRACATTSTRPSPPRPRTTSDHKERPSPCRSTSALPGTRRAAGGSGARPRYEAFPQPLHWPAMSSLAERCRRC